MSTASRRTPQPSIPTAAVPVKDPAPLRVGDLVEARRWDTVRYRGEVDAVMPQLGVLWILEEPLRARKMIEVAEYAVAKVGVSGARC